MAKEYDSDIVLNDLENFLFDSFNLFIKGAVKGLSKDEAEGGGSPVHTGYFASSWTAGYNRPKREPYEVSDQNRKGLGGVDGSEEWGSAYWKNLELKTMHVQQLECQKLTHLVHHLRVELSYLGT